MSDTKVEEVRKILAKVNPTKLSVTTEGNIILDDEDAAKALRDIARAGGTVQPQDTNIPIGPLGNCNGKGLNVIFC